MGSILPKIQDVFCVELRMNQSPEEDFEEVESTFASKTSEKQKDKLRTRKNIFNRPFATESNIAPTYFETSSTRKTIGHPDTTELLERRKPAVHETEIEYIDEELEEKRPSRHSSTSSKKKEKLKKNILTKVGWSVAGVLILRLIFMDRGVWDYFSTEAVIKNKKEELRSIQNENKELRNEITRIQVDRNYQKQLAKEHLGVIAVDEFLILFAGESSDTTETSDRTF
jgi:cell division protein FtsB